MLKNWNSILIKQQIPISPSAEALITTILLHVSMSLITLDTSCKCYCIVFVFLWLAYFTILYHVTEFLSFLRLNNIPLYVKFCLSHSSADGCLGCFYLLVIVNNAAIRWVYTYLLASLLLRQAFKIRPSIFAFFSMLKTLNIQSVKHMREKTNDKPFKK